MPGIGAAIWGGVTAVWGYIGGFVINAVVSFGISYAATALFGKDPKTPSFDNSLKDNLQGATNPIPIVYGRRTLGGTKVFCDVTGTDNKYLHTILTLSEGEIASIETIYLDDIAIDAEDWIVGSGLSQIEHAWGYTHTGADNQTVDASLHGLLPEKWTTNHRLQGIAYVYVRLKFNRDIFDHIPNITANIKGVKVYDPRIETTVWSDNPALCIRDYLTNTRYGRGIPESMIDDDAIIAAANYCEQQTTFYDATGSSYLDNRYRCNGAINIDDSSLDNVKKLLSSCRGQLIFSSGLYKLCIDKPETVTFAFTPNNICGKIAVSLGDKSVVFNRMRITYYDKDLNWEQNYYVYDNADLRDNQDNGVILEGSLDLPLTGDIVRVEQIAQTEVKRSRQAIVCTFDSTLEALAVDVGDVVTVEYDLGGWTAKKFRVVKLGIKSEDTVEVSLKEYDDSTYLLDAWVPTAEPDTLDPSGWNYDPPNNVSVTSGNSELLIAGDGSLISRIRLAWTSPENGYCTNFEAGFKLSSESAWTDYALTADVLQHLFSPVQDGSHYDLRVRAVYFNGGHSNWVEILDHTVQGKTALPDTPTGFAVTNEPNNIKKFEWNEISNLDLRGYRLRYVAGSTGEWADMTALHSGVLAGSPWETSSITASGNHRFGLVSVDTSGNESLPLYFNLALANVVDGGTAPAGPTDLVATAMYLSVFLEWTNPTENFSATEIWLSDYNDRAEAILIASTAAPIFQIERDYSDTAYVWIRSINAAGTPGPFNSAATSGTQIAALDTINATSAAAITATSAKIANLYAANIAAGAITSGTIIIGPGGAIRSHNYEPNEQGWKLDQSGAELVSALIRGTISAGGTIQSANFQTGIQGFQITGAGHIEAHSITIYGAVPAPALFIGGQPSTGGYFISSITLTIKSASNTTTRYKTDGTIPLETDPAISNGKLIVSSSQELVLVSFDNTTGRASEPFFAPFYISRPLPATVGEDSLTALIRSNFVAPFICVAFTINLHADPTTLTYTAYDQDTYYRTDTGLPDGYKADITLIDSGFNSLICYFHAISSYPIIRIGPIYRRRYDAFSGTFSEWITGIETWDASTSDWDTFAAPSGTVLGDDWPYS